MQAVQFDEGLRVVSDAKKPFPPPGWALIRVRRAGICGTDLEIIRGYKDFQGILGHEFVGDVVEAPATDWIGRRTCGEINVACGHCDLCRRGWTGHCRHRTVTGIMNQPGAFAEFLTVPLDNLHEVPSGVSDEEAVFAEPLAAAFEILEQVTVSPGEPAIVLGDGRLGILCAQALGAVGAEVQLVGRHPRKLEVAAACGIPARNRADGLAPGRWPLVIDATGSPSGLSDALTLVEPRGTIVLKSTFAHPAPVDLSSLVVNEITMIGSRCGPFPRALEALQRKIVTVTPLIDASFPLGEALDAFALAATPGVLKVLLTP